MCADCCLQYNEGARPYECHHCQAWLEPDMMRPIVDKLKADRLKADCDKRLHADTPTASRYLRPCYYNLHSLRLSSKA